jgi:cell fate (sporulation/competence/biofilm development) regulator YlbF (YheA/YmcA/DUF963 family)
LLTENSAAAQAQRFLQENSIGASIAAVEFQRAEEAKKLLNPYGDIQRLLQRDVGVQATIEAAMRQENLTAKISTDFPAAQEFSKHLDHYRDIAKQYEASFRLPQAVEASRFLADMQLDGGAVAAYARKQLSGMASQQDLVASITRPWMREMDTARSVTALIELQGLGSALRSIQGFDTALTTALRADLGDWRDRIAFPQLIFENPVARTEFYVERGFNSALTDFPEEAFQESLVLVGLDADSQDVIEWPETLHATDAIEEMAFRRTNKCHNYLQRLERRLRQFIDAAMTAQYGADWPKKRLAPQMLESWESKKSRAENSGIILTTFIEVADFTDYEAIICRKDHWKEVFQGRFKRPESVRESLQRLYPIRLATMHARFVTKEDELYLVAESMRLLSAIGS